MNLLLPNGWRKVPEFLPVGVVGCGNNNSEVLPTQGDDVYPATSPDLIFDRVDQGTGTARKVWLYILKKQVTNIIAWRPSTVKFRVTLRWRKLASIRKISRSICRSCGPGLLQEGRDPETDLADARVHCAERVGSVGARYSNTPAVKNAKAAGLKVSYHEVAGGSHLEVA